MAGYSERPERPPAQTVAVALGLSPDLLAAATRRYEAQTGRSATVRSTIGFAVDQHLPRLTAGLLGLGFRGGEIGKRKPRRINRVDWDRLQQAAAATGVPASGLLRACLEWIKDNPIDQPQ